MSNPEPEPQETLEELFTKPTRPTPDAGPEGSSRCARAIPARHRPVHL
jgi:hypothetical protein